MQKYEAEGSKNDATNSEKPIDISIADRLLEQLQEEYYSVLSQNMPKQNEEPEEDQQNPYQSLEGADFDDDSDSNSSDGSDEPQQEQAESHDRIEELQDHQSKESQQQIPLDSNPEVAHELIEVQPTPDAIYSDLPHKEFEIDEEKVKKLTLEMDIDFPEWIKSRNQCQQRLEALFLPKGAKPFTKI